MSKQEAAMHKAMDRSRERADKRKSKWEAYSDRADQPYNDWFDRVME